MCKISFNPVQGVNFAPVNIGAMNIHFMQKAYESVVY